MAAKSEKLSQLDRVIARVCGVLRRYAGIEIVQVGYSDNVSDYPLAPGFKQVVFESHAIPDAVQALELVHVTQMQEGDSAVVTFTTDGQYAGHQMYTSWPTKVNDRVEFFYSDHYLYSYAAVTDRAFRGLGLSPARWTEHKRWRQQRGREQPVVFYIGLDNLSSLASGDGESTIVIGYSAIVTVGSFVWCWNSPACRAQGVGFRKIT